MATSLNSLISLMGSLVVCKKRGVKMVNYLVTLNIKMGVFMDLGKQTIALAWRMKLSPWATTKNNQKIYRSILIRLVTASLFLLVPLASASNDLPYYNDEAFSPIWLAPNSPELSNFHRIPEFSFTDQNGDTVTQETFEGKIYVAGFFFSTCPGICPSVRSKLKKVQAAFIDDPNVKIVQHSIRPTTDTIEVLQTYAKQNEIDGDKWYLLTGDKKKIYDLAKSAYFASEDLGNIQNTNDFLHTESLLLIDQNRHIRGIYNGLNSASVDYLIADIKALNSENM